MNKITTYKKRALIRAIVEAKTPLKVGTGEKNIETDAVIAKDVNGLPYIPGTSLAGVLKHLYGSQFDELFGFHTKTTSSGSKLIVSEARMVGSNSEVQDGLRDINWNDDFYSHFMNLPIRQHVKINHLGVDAGGGKFDNQIVYKGTRFCFEIEILLDDENDTLNEERVNKILDILRSEDLYIGAKSRAGYGKLEVVDLLCRYINLVGTDLEDYKKKSSSLNDTEFWENQNKIKDASLIKSSALKYELEIAPEGFFLFGSGLSDSEANITAVEESMICWNNDKGEFKSNTILIPGSSIKGALSHRVAFHYNKLKNNYANDTPDLSAANVAVNALFGYEEKVSDTHRKFRGNVIISDLLEIVDKQKTKLLTHVKIDRFTGGAIDSALFSEKVKYIVDKKCKFKISILVYDKMISEDKDIIIKALEFALNDIATGRLSLGGGVNRGNGIFKGSFKKNGEIWKKY